MNADSTIKLKADKKKRPKGYWNHQIRTWHWISGATSLIGTLLFAFTGITLNHAGDIGSATTVLERTAVLPDTLLSQLEGGPVSNSVSGIPAPVAQWLDRELGANVAPRTGEWSDYDIYVGMPGPGKDAWLSIDRETGEVIYETSDRGVISYLNDLHKGRDTGTAWAWFIDIFAVACIVFCLTGLWLLQMHARRRPSTWPLVGAGILIPALLAIFLIH